MTFHQDGANIDGHVPHHLLAQVMEIQQRLQRAGRLLATTGDGPAAEAGARRLRAAGDPPAHDGQA